MCAQTVSNAMPRVNPAAARTRTTHPSSRLLEVDRISPKHPTRISRCRTCHDHHPTNPRCVRCSDTHARTGPTQKDSPRVSVHRVHAPCAGRKGNLCRSSTRFDRIIGEHPRHPAKYPARHPARCPDYPRSDRSQPR